MRVSERSLDRGTVWKYLARLSSSSLSFAAMAAAAVVVDVVYASSARLCAGALGGARGSAVLGGDGVHMWWWVRG